VSRARRARRTHQTPSNTKAQSLVHDRCAPTPMAEAMPARRMRTDGLIRPGGKTARHAEMVQHQGENHKAASNLSVSLSAGCKAGRHTPRQAALANVRPSYLTLFATIKLLSRVRRLFGKQLSAASCSPDFRRSRGSARTPIAACPWMGR